jgi:hypothetical protein
MSLTEWSRRSGRISAKAAQNGTGDTDMMGKKLCSAFD